MIPEIYLDTKSVSILNYDKLPEDLLKSIIDDLNVLIHWNMLECYSKKEADKYIEIFGSRKQLFKYLRNLSTITDFIIKDI